MMVDHAGGVLESAGLCLNQRTSTPFIPGSAVKGCARAAALARVKELEPPALKTALLVAILRVFGWSPAEVRTPESSDLRWAYGAPLPDFPEKTDSYEGVVAFLPAFPTTQPELVIDMLACHHAKYYQEKRQEATDDEGPNVQTFPAVEAGVEFLFAVVPSSGGERLGSDADNLCRQALGYLKEGLEHFGIGAKAAAGYGYFVEEPSRLQGLLAESQRDAEQDAVRAMQRAQASRHAGMSEEETFLEDLHAGRIDVLQAFSAAGSYSEAKQKDLMRFIAAQGAQRTLNPSGNRKGQDRVQKFAALCLKLGVEVR
jgi:CRISPR type III-B/RAMP module RAMP protein Cmr6